MWIMLPEGSKHLIDYTRGQAGGLNPGGTWVSSIIGISLMNKTLLRHQVLGGR